VAAPSGIAYGQGQGNGWTSAGQRDNGGYTARRVEECRSSRPVQASKPAAVMAPGLQSLFPLMRPPGKLAIYQGVFLCLIGWRWVVWDRLRPLAGTVLGTVVVTSSFAHDCQGRYVLVDHAARQVSATRLRSDTTAAHDFSLNLYHRRVLPHW
jgi:hypothetical protein